MRLVDTHCHLQMAQYQDDRDQVIKRSLEAGTGLILVGTNLVDSTEGIALAEKYPDQPVYAAIGMHPTDEDLASAHPAQLEALLGSQKIVAVGETGLDYFHVTDVEQQDLQVDVFEQHLLLALQANLPVIIHCRDRRDTYQAYDDMLALLIKNQVKRFVMHCYSGDWERAAKFLELGGYLSFTGIVTFPKNDMMLEVVKRTPLDRMMVETDAPFLTPEPHRGQRNEPAFVIEVAKKIAVIRDMNVEDIAAQTTKNAQIFFGLT